MHRRTHLKILAATVATATLARFPTAFAADTGAPWPSDVADFQALAPGEHPRLLFRKSDLPRLRQKAATPEGQAILKRLRATLDAKNGDTFPTVFNGSGQAYQGNRPAAGAGAADANQESETANPPKAAGKNTELPLGAFTISHAAGYGLLYQLTGEKKFADLGKEAMQKALAGIRDRDDRYSFRKPGGALRCGPSLGWTALGYDLCYDGWDADFRRKVAEEFSKYNEGPHCAIEDCILGRRQHPGSNHWGMEVGGSAMAMLAILNDPGCDMKKFGPLVGQSTQIMLRNMTQGFGDGGFFAEGDGTGSMSSHIVFLTALQAWKTALGKDFISPRPNAQWMANRWFLQTLARDGKPDYHPQRGAYPQNIWSRGGLSGGGYFSIGMGVAASADVQAAIAWYYHHTGFAELDAKNGTPFDTPSPYPHHAVLAFVNWPVGLAEKNPAGIIPNALHDSKWGFYAWRNRWSDSGDVVISILTKNTKGNYSCKAEGTLSINDAGRKLTWGKIPRGFKGDFKPAKDGSTVLPTADGSCLAIDFSQASGAEAMLVMTGPGAPADNAVEAGGVRFGFLFLGKRADVKPTVDGSKIKVGGQTVAFQDGLIILGK